MSHPVTTCRESRLSCIHLPSSVALWCRTLWCYYCWGGAFSVEHPLGTWQFVPPTSLCHFQQQQSVHPTHLGHKIRPWKRHLMLLVGHLLKQVLDDWSGTLSNELCSWHCSGNLPAKEWYSAYLDPPRCRDLFGAHLVCSTDFVESCWL